MKANYVESIKTFRKCAINYARYKETPGCSNTKMYCFSRLEYSNPPITDMDSVHIYIHIISRSSSSQLVYKNKYYIILYTMPVSDEQLAESIRKYAIIYDKGRSGHKDKLAVENA